MEEVSDSSSEDTDEQTDEDSDDEKMRIAKQRQELIEMAEEQPKRIHAFSRNRYCPWQRGKKP